MENAGADVFSVTGLSGCIAVYCTHSERLSVDEIDAEIEKVLETNGAFYQIG